MPTTSKEHVPRGWGPLQLQEDSVLELFSRAALGFLWGEVVTFRNREPV